MIYAKIRLSKVSMDIFQIQKMDQNSMDTLII